MKVGLLEILPLMERQLTMSQVGWLSIKGDVIERVLHSEGVMTTKASRASCDEDGVIGMRHDYQMVCWNWEHDKTLSLAFHGFDTM